MSESQPFVIAIIFGLISGFLIIGIWYVRQRHTRQHLQQRKTTTTEDSVISYRVRNENGSVMGELFVSKSGIRFEEYELSKFELTIEAIEKIIYNKRSLQIVSKNGTTHTLRYLREGPAQESMWFSTATYGQMSHSVEALENFLATMQELNIRTEEGFIDESRYFYANIFWAAFAIGLLILFAIAHFVFGFFP